MIGKPRLSRRALSPRHLSYLWDLLRSLVDRDMKLMYKRSALGIAWTLISPLLQLLVFIFVFQVIIKMDIPQYSSYVFTGLLVWNWFQNSLFQATGIIISSRPLIRQPGFPNAILPIVVVTTGLIHFILALPVLVVFLLIDGVQLTPVVLALPLLQIIQFALTVTFSYFLASLNVTFRDTQHTLGVLLQFLFYLTPIFYELGSIPDRYWFIYGLNPMVHIVTCYRQILIWGTQPDWLALAIIAGAIAVLMPIGYKLFKHQSLRFVEEI
ncbi:MAG: ABC transporter permease [Synechococcales cyanobacterium K44_A2020_017]|uniref:ABC transporter permease n=1 Tax=Leptolyngbya sp. CCY15150 TaxID=2767772 RepID=UPI00194E7D92|nr:ABC transporter permease [Leptolyngbya sp. CCY15150]MBF2088579.1 ABC transporter permease [Synechococcales cyanobacterium K32_A2020_035]MBF2095366.1 ABC transporter permease [Synechococcales cyanobacterium K44_A2020_017]